MANCRIQNLQPVCAYNGSGVTAVMLLDLEDFLGFVYEGGGGYQSAYVESIVRSGNFITIEFNDFPAQYTGQLNAGIYSHRVEAFLQGLSSEMIANLHLATKRPQLAVFKTWDGKYFTFGQETGAKVNYSVQTADNTGAALTLTQNTPYPLYEVDPEALIESDVQPAMWAVVFDDTAVCELNGTTDQLTGFLQAALAVRVSVITGQPLDRDDRPIATSMLKQAALALTGTTAPSIYEVTGNFNPRQLVGGEPSVRYAPDICEEGAAASWVLDTGFWDMSAYWLDDGIWNF